MKVYHELPTEAPVAMNVRDLEPGQWCIDTDGDYWMMSKSGDPILLNSNGVENIADTSYIVREILPPGTKITIIV